MEICHALNIEVISGLCPISFPIDQYISKKTSNRLLSTYEEKVNGLPHYSSAADNSVGFVFVWAHNIIRAFKKPLKIHTQEPEVDLLVEYRIIGSGIFCKGLDLRLEMSMSAYATMYQSQVYMPFWRNLVSWLTREWMNESTAVI